MSAWTFIARSELASAGTIIFSSIPTTYTDLVILVSVRGASSPFLGMGFNGGTSGFFMQKLEGDGSGAYGATRSDTFVGYMTGSSSPANNFGNGLIYIPDYRSSVNKTFSVDLVSVSQQIVSGSWSNTAAISSIELYEWGSGNSKNNFAANTSATLYGITKGSSGGVTVS
jgi:hypothetical protein